MQHLAAAPWQRQHIDELAARLGPLHAMPDGTLADVTTALHRIRIIKQGHQIHFYFVNSDGELDGPMSRIDLRRPLHLIAEYTQAAALSLIWQPAPARIGLLGLAGGRLSLVLYHHLPQATIDNIEIDARVGPLAERFFGLQFDQRQRLVVSDARSYLERTEQRYDILVMDAFRDASDDLDHLATREFYRICKGCLRPEGVIAVNTLASDPHFPEKLATFEASFRHSAAVALKHGAVLIGGDRSNLSHAEIIRRAQALAQQHQFDFPFAERAGQITSLRGLLRSLGVGRERTAVLSDQVTEEAKEQK
ncbi:spermidine synthase [Chloroflexia bacterium SDU3-3]|nr:spermidine synthase [Chloroflexia bacterium SDU3-3]